MTGSNPEQQEAGEGTHLPHPTTHPWAWLPNALTMARVMAAPVILAALITASLQHPDARAAPALIIALACLVMSALFDVLDGRLARAWHVESAFGQFWDPVADKLVVGAASIGISLIAPLAWPATLAIIARDAAVTYWRVSGVHSADKAAPVTLAKWKTAIEFIALIVMLLGSLGVQQSGVIHRIVPIGFLLFYAAAILSVWTGWQYVRPRAERR